MFLVGTGVKDASGKEITIGIEGTYNPQDLQKILKNNNRMIILALTGKLPGVASIMGPPNPVTGASPIPIPNELSKLTPQMITNTGIPVFKIDNGTLTQIENNAADVNNWGKYDYSVKATDKPNLNLSAFNTGFGQAHPILTTDAQTYGYNRVTKEVGAKFASDYAAPQGAYAAGDFGDFGGMVGRQGMQSTYSPTNETELKAAKDAGIIPQNKTLTEAQNDAKKAQAGKVTRGSVVTGTGQVISPDGTPIGQTPAAASTAAAQAAAAGSTNFAATQGIPGVDMPFGGINPLQAFANQTPGQAAGFALGSGMLPGFANQNLAAAYRNIYPGLANAYNLALQTGRLTAPVIGQGIAGTDIQAPGVGFAQFTQGGGGNIAQGLQQDLQSIQNVKAKVKAANGTTTGLTQQELVLYQQIISDPETEYKIRDSLIRLTSPNAATEYARRTMLNRAYSMGELQAPGQLAMTPGGFGNLGAAQASQYVPPTGAFTPTAPAGLPPGGTPPIGQPPMSQPPMGQPPMGQPPIGQPPIGQPPMGQPPMGQPPMGQPANTEPAAQTAAQAAAMAAATNANLNRMQAQADANPRAGGDLAMSAAGSGNLLQDLMRTIDTTNTVGTSVKGGLDMNNLSGTGSKVEVSNLNESAVQINPGTGIKGNPAMLDLSAANFMGSNPQGVDQTANDKIFYVDDDGNNVFTFVNKEKISQQAKAQAAATGTPWYDTVYITDPLTGKSLGLKKDSTSPSDDAPYKVMFVGRSGATDIDTSPQTVVDQPLKQMDYSTFQGLMGGGYSDTGGAGLFPTTSDITDEAPGIAWEQLKKDIGKAKTFKELADLQQSVLNPRAAAQKKEEDEMAAFNQFMGQGEMNYGR